jgi:hypothetical protein
MKFVIRAFALTFVLAGAAAVSLSSATTSTVSNHLSATAGLPVPICGPNAPCPPDPWGAHAR